jgi:hypothetical protein
VQGKRYNCLECGQLFPTKQKCKIHLSNIHDTVDQQIDEGFIVIFLKNEDDCSKCEVCKATFFMPEELSNHIKTKHTKLFLITWDLLLSKKGQWDSIIKFIDELLVDCCVPI